MTPVHKPAKVAQTTGLETSESLYQRMMQAHIDCQVHMAVAPKQMQLTLSACALQRQYSEQFGSLLTWS